MRSFAPVEALRASMRFTSLGALHSFYEYDPSMRGRSAALRSQEALARTLGTTVFNSVLRVLVPSFRHRLTAFLPRELRKQRDAFLLAVRQQVAQRLPMKRSESDSRRRVANLDKAFDSLVTGILETTNASALHP